MSLRAESRNGVAERSTEVIVYEPVIFDETKTTVLKNNTKKIVFGSKASGTERPALEFGLYYASGPKLDDSEKFQTNCQAIADGINEPVALRTMLTESRDQNRRMEQQMKRLKLVWTGLQTMCEVLEKPCTCKDDTGSEQVTEPAPTTTQGPSKYDSGPQSTTKEPSKHGSQTQYVTEDPLQHDSGPKYIHEESTKHDSGSRSTASESSNQEPLLRILSVASSGNRTGETTLSVSYTAAAEHATDWVIVYDELHGHANFVRTTGKSVSGHNMTYINTVVTRQNHLLDKMTFYLYAGNTTASVEFNVKMIGRHITLKQTVPAYKSPVLLANTEYVAPSNGELNITFVLNKTYDKLNEKASDTMLRLVGFNDSKGKPSLYDKYDFHAFDYPGEPVTKTTSRLILTLKPPYAQFGGILTVNFPHQDLEQQHLSGNILEKIRYGFTVTVLLPNKNVPVPENSVALYTVFSENKLLMAPPPQTIMCIAMGNPTPSVKVFRESDDGRRKEIPAEKLNKNNWTQGALLTLDERDRKTPGTYVCRAQSGSAVAENRNEVDIEPVIFDDARSVVVKNNTKELVVRCKASGRERPELEFRARYTTGRNMAELDNCEVKQFLLGKRTNRVRLTISPPDSNIDTVYCVARLQGIERYKKIELFPGRSHDFISYKGAPVIFPDDLSSPLYSVEAEPGLETVKTEPPTGLVGPEPMEVEHESESEEAEPESEGQKSSDIPNQNFAYKPDEEFYAR